MKLRNLFIAAVAGLFGLAACEGLEQDLGIAKISIDPLELTFPKEESSLQVTMIATRDWSVSVNTLPEWIALSATEGKASANAQTISVTVEKNDGNDREAAIVITAGMVRATLTVKQAGAKGEIQKGDGTKENPYSVAGVLEYLGTLGADVNSPDKVYVQGKVASIKEAFSAQYGNSTFDITDDGVVSDTKFTAYRVLYLGNKKWAEGNAQIQVGDDVILYGNVVNFKGNTPETQQGSAFLYSLNGQNEGGDNGGGSSSGTTAEPAGDGSQANPFNVAAAIAKAKEVGETATTESYYIKGKVSTVKEAFGAQYGNGTFELVDEGYTAVFTAFRILYLGNQKWVEGNSSVAVGDEIVVVGKIVNFKGNTPETSQGSGYLYSLNGQTGGGDQPGPVEETTAEAAGDGSQANPFNVAAAIAKAKEVGETATTESYYIKGKVSTVKEAFGAQYGNGTFELIDEGYTAVFTAFRVLYFGNQKWVEGDASVAQGDEIVVVGKIVNYKGNTPETAQGSGYLYSLNGQTSIEQSDVFGVEKTEINVSASATSATVKVTGNVAWTATSTATIDKASGEGAGEIAVSFPANEDTENAKTYTVTLSTTADVDAKTITVTITQAKASGQASGEEVVVELSEAQLAALKDNNAANALDDVISLTNSSNYNGTAVTQLRIYKNATMTIAANGGTITKIEFTCTANGTAKQGPGCWGAGTPEGYTFESEGKNGTWEGQSESVSFTATDNQVRIASLKVTYVTK